MDAEQGQREDDDVMDNQAFFSPNVHTHFLRKRLTDTMDAKTHWVFAMGPDCMGIAFRLNQRHMERCDGTGIELLSLGSLTMPATILLFPRDKLDLEEFAAILGGWPTSQEVVESKDYITIATEGHELLMSAVSQWISVDHLLS